MKSLVRRIVGIAICMLLFIPLTSGGNDVAASPTYGDASVIDIAPATGKMYDGLQLAQNGRYAEAIPLLEAAIEADPTLIGAWETLGWSYWHVGRKDEAQSLWERLLLLSPDTPQAYGWLAQLAAERKDLDSAASLYLKALGYAPDDFESRLNLGRVYLWKGRLGEAILVLTALMADDPDRLDVVLELARAMQYSLQYEQSLPLWEQLLEVAPDDLEYRLGVALAMLHTGRRAEGVAMARSILNENPRSVAALTILADDAEYGDRPAAARPYLYRAIDASEDPEEIEFLRRRLVTLLVRLYINQPRIYSLEAPIRVSRDRVQDQPMNLDARLLLGELLLLHRDYDAAEAEFLRVLREFNQRNIRARRGLFEIELARFRFREAFEHLEIIRAFNPRDPYLLVDEAMLNARQGHYTRTHAALDQLERIGGQGAAAVLLYHVLTSSEIGPALPLSNFRDHLVALQKAGYRFLSVDELPGYMDQVRGMPDRVAGMAPTRAVVVTFDDGLEHAMQLATPVAQDLGLVFSQFLSVAAIERNDPLVAGWDALRAFQATGRWQYGSRLLEAHDVAQVFRAGEPDVPLANRIWHHDLHRLETLDEFDARLRREYTESRAIIESRLKHPIASVAYPFGDIGQDGHSNEPQAFEYNVAHAASQYRSGFLVRSQGHAVQGDNPMLYGRFEPSNFITGEELTVHLLSQHPVFLAQRLRLEFAAFEGRRQLARSTLNQMANSGYPEAEVKRLKEFIRANLARKFDMPVAVDDIRKSPWSLQLSQPYLGVAVHRFEDSLDGESLRLYGSGGLHLTPNLALEARAGAGWHSQPEVATNFVPGAVDDRPDIKIRESFTSLSAAFILPRRTVLTTAFGLREFSEDADWRMWYYGADLNVRPIEPVDLKLSFDHDVLTGSRAIRRELTYDRLAAHGVWSPIDRLDIWGSAQHFEISDDNRRTHWHVLPMVVLWRPPGLVAGIRYAEDNSRTEDRDYWTPYRQQGIHLEAGFRGSWRRNYYSLIGRVGQARERIRPESMQSHQDLVTLYEDLLLQARRGRWGRQVIADLTEDLEDLRANSPESKWQSTIGVQAACVLRWGKHWQIEGQVSREESPRYRETHLSAGLKYLF